MENPAPRILKVLPRPSDTLLLPSLALRRLTSKENGIYASADDLYKSAVFGRDSLEVAEDLMFTRPKLVRTVLRTMARLQGRDNNDINEEEPGRIVHEYRTLVVDGKLIDARSRSIFTQLASKWGGSDTELAYYGSVDATPLFLKVLAAYCESYGDAVLQEEIIHKDNQVTTLQDAARAAASWLRGHLEISRSGLLEFHRRNPEGIMNQVWKDSEEFYVHLSGELANHERPIASIEAQALAYDGLLAAAYLLPDEAEIYRRMATDVRNKTIELLWEEDKKYFALGLDYDKKEDMRIIRTSTANPAALLDSGFFDDLGAETRQKYVSSLIKKVMSYDFLTNAGIRSRALSAAHLTDFWDYHGSFVSWPKETYDIARGLARQGFPKLARELENRLLNVVLKHRQYPEFVYVDGWGRIMDSTPSRHSHGNVTVVHSTNNPERIQAWTVSAIMAITHTRMSSLLRFRSEPVPLQPWQRDLERDILRHIPHVPRHLNPFTLQQQYRKHRYKLGGADET